MSGQHENNDASALVKQALDLYESSLIAYAASILNGDIDRARDVVQDTFLKLYLAEPDKVRENLKAWLYTVCRNRAFDVLRKEHRITFTDDNDTLDWLDEWQSDPSDDASREEMLEHVWAAIEQLPPNQREVIRLKFQHGLSYKEISASTGLSVTNVGFLIHTGIRRLRKLMNRAFADP